MTSTTIIFRWSISSLSFSVDCIWDFNRCVQFKTKSDKECKEDFNVCSMIAMGMPPGTTTTTTTTEPPDLPDFLKPTPTTKRPLRPISDIDLPDQVQVIEQGETTAPPVVEEEDDNFDCIIELLKCQEQGRAQCYPYQRCIMVAAVTAETEEPTRRPESSYLPPAPGSVGQGAQDTLVGSASTTVPTMVPGGENRKLKHNNSQIDRLQDFLIITITIHFAAECVWNYFSCTGSDFECKRKFRKCSNGKSRKFF